MNLLGAVGRVIPAGSFVTGLMVWRDVDFGVDAAGLGEREAWETMWPLVSIATAVRYKDDRDDRRHYFVLVVEGWKLDVPFWTDGAPPVVERFQSELQSRLDQELRLTILRLKDHWHREPSYPETVGGFEIYDAVLNHGVRTLEELDHYLSERALPPRVL
jgi:hypothetical protein